MVAAWRPVETARRSDSWAFAGKLENALEVTQERRLRLGAHDAADHLAAEKDRHRRNRHDLVAAGDLGVLVDVDLGDGDLVAVLGRNLLEHRGDHLARPAPLGPEIDQHRLVAAEYVRVERGVRDGLGGRAHGHSLGMSCTTSNVVGTTVIPVNGPGDPQWSRSAKYRSASSAAAHPVPAAVIAWR